MTILAHLLKISSVTEIILNKLIYNKENFCFHTHENVRHRLSIFSQDCLLIGGSR